MISGVSTYSLLLYSLTILVVDKVSYLIGSSSLVVLVENFVSMIELSPEYVGIERVQSSILLSELLCLIKRDRRRNSCHVHLREDVIIFATNSSRVQSSTSQRRCCHIHIYISFERRCCSCFPFTRNSSRVLSPTSQSRCCTSQRRCSFTFKRNSSQVPSYISEKMFCHIYISFERRCCLCFHICAFTFPSREDVV